jgi:hypothetical protein
MNLAIKSNLPTPPEPGEVDGSENNRFSVNSLKILSLALVAGIVINTLHTHTRNKILVLFLFVSFLFFGIRGMDIFFKVPGIIQEAG